MPKVLMDIPDEACRNIISYSTFKESMKNAIVFPTDATNGEILTALFPTTKTEQMGEYVVAYGLEFEGIPFFKNWWDAPYKWNTVLKELNSEMV